MFDKKQKDAYMGTKAPQDLKDRIMSDSLQLQRRSGKRGVNTYLRRAAVAAVVALVFIGGVVCMRNADVSVAHGGYEVGYAAKAVESEIYPVSVTESRYNGPDGVHLAIRQIGSCKVEVTCGRLYILKDGDEFITDAGVPYRLNGGAEVIWDACGDDECILTVTKWGKIREYVLKFDPEKKTYTISRKAV